jgi:hypothetical protein
MAANPTGYSNPECYAQTLGDCRGPVNREHVVSEGVLKLVSGRAGEINKQVLVRGLSFQPPGVVEEKGISRLVAKMLCEGHNLYLSERIDPAGQAMFRAVEALNDAAGDPAALHQMFRVDGDDLERWMLKTFINGLFSGVFRPASGETLKEEYPPLEWLQILFKDAEFPKGCGLYWLAGTVGAVFTADQEVLQFEPINEQGTEVICGMRVRFFGFNFALAMGWMLPGGSGPFANIDYRPAGLRAVGSNTRIKFDWRDSEGDEILMQALPRAANRVGTGHSAR